MSDNKNKIIIIGAGPVGLSAAILLAKTNKFTNIDIYENRLDIPNNPEESYPIGLNPRGLYTLNQIHPDLELDIKKEGEIIESWQIYAGTYQVAKLYSNAVYGTSRGKVNLSLYQYAIRAYPSIISVYFGFKLIAVDTSSKTLVFTAINSTNQDQITIDASLCRVIAADGVYSKVGRELAAKIPQRFSRIVTSWTNEYRVLFAKPGQKIENLDKKVHYIFNSCYTATIDNQGQSQWTCVMTAKDQDDWRDREVILSKSHDSLASLKALVSKRAPWLAGVFQDDELIRFFSRKSYRGAIVECSTCRIDEWIILLGDAHHSVLPPTGEGINSGLEDALFLFQAFQTSPDSPFQTYEKNRCPDLNALLTYAKYLNDAPWSGESGARLFFQILEGRDKANSISYQLFGPGSLTRPAYREIIEKWNRKRRIYLPICRAIVYPFAILFHIIALPLTIFKHLTKTKIEIDKTLKPPV